MTEQNAEIPANPAAPAVPADQAAQAPVDVEPTWAESPEAAPAKSDQGENKLAAEGSDPLADGGLATITLTDADGFETEVPCLVFDTFEHDDAEGETAVHAHVVVLPPTTVVRRDRLTAIER